MFRKIFISLFVLSNLSLWIGNNVQAQEKKNMGKSFVHPGMMQDRQSLERMKQKIASGENEWKTAFANLQRETPLDFEPEPRTHISVGPYNTNSSGGREYAKSAMMCYNNALMWYITGNKAYADKAIRILNAWSYTLWDFDDNDAKLNVGLRGPYFLNAAEILKYSNAGWKEKDIQQFKKMVLTVFYPTIKDFFTEANGNWDASIIYTLLCIGVFTDDHAIFNSAVERFYRGPGNSGITKYIYPNGQIQEATRDWDHAQLGIGEFAKAAKVAWTQGLDFYAAANNRLALGFEYNCKFLLDEEVPVYGIVSTREKEKLKDIYESVYYHYRFVKGIEMPFTKRILEKTRPNSSVGLLTSLSGPSATAKKVENVFATDKIPAITSLAGALPAAVAKAPEGSVFLSPGDSIQAALDQQRGTKGWVVLRKGIHILNAPLRIPSNITLSGEGRSSIIFLSPKLSGKTIVNADTNLHDVVIRDLLIEGATNVATNADPNHDRRTRSYMNALSREGVAFTALHEGQMKNILFENVTIQNFTRSGVAIRGASNVTINRCDFSDNGSSVVPGAGFHHNLLLTHSTNCRITGSRFDTSPFGNGIDVTLSQNITISYNETARNRGSGIRCGESSHVQVTGNFAEGNDENGITIESMMNGTSDISIVDNFSGNNTKQGLRVEKVTGKKISGNKQFENGKGK